MTHLQTAHGLWLKGCPWCPRWQKSSQTCACRCEGLLLGSVVCCNIVVSEAVTAAAQPVPVTAHGREELRPLDPRSGRAHPVTGICSGEQTHMMHRAVQSSLTEVSRMWDARTMRPEQAQVQSR